nr:zinc finger, CCHC-type, retrotransposon Gag domain protein [Tanacetum cinerariifolium]
MVNTRTDADLSAAVQNALQTLLPRIREEIREEFRTGSGSSNAGGNPPPVTIHTWLERFNKQKPHSFEKATAPVDAKNWISHMEKIFDVMGCEDAFKTRLDVYKFEGNARFQEIILSTVFPSSEAGALEEGVSSHSSDKVFLFMIRVEGAWPIEMKDSAMWVWDNSTWGSRGKGFGTIQVVRAGMGLGKGQV